MLRYWLLRDWMKALYCLFLDRKDIKAGLKTILQGIEYIKRGISICIFPEGTRNRTDEMLPFKEGSMKIAEKTGCPIIPMAITLISAAREHRAQVALFGHTHLAREDYEDGLYLMNPGRLGGWEASYGILDITPQGIVTNVVRLEGH